MKCEKCGWEMDYRPRSFQEQLKEIIEGQDKKDIRCAPIVVLR